jgi:syntaxin-binding protein 1
MSLAINNNNYVSRGIKGELKSYLSSHIFDKIDSLSKILILDNFTLKFVNLCMDKNELMSRNIFEKDLISNNRKSISVSTAIYFVSPTEENIQIILNDWREENKYKSLHIFFPTKTPNQLIRKLIPIGSKIRSLFDLLICDFRTPEILIFDLGIDNDFLKFFGNITNPNNLINSISQLSNIFFLLKNIPEIRYFNSNISSNFAKEFTNVLESKRADFNGFSKKSTLLILDRSYDIISPFLHEFTYQSVLYDFYVSDFDNETGESYVYERNVTRDGRNIIEKFTLDENDPIWMNFKYRHILDCISEYNALIENLDKKYPNIAKYQKDKNSVSLGDVGSAIKELAIYDNEKRLISAHGEILKKLLEIYDYDMDENSQVIKLKHIEDLEKKLISKEKCQTIFQETEKILKSTDVSYSTKIRLFVLYAITQGKKKLEILMQSANVNLDIEAILNNIAIIKKVKQEQNFKDIITNLINKTLDQTIFPSIGNGTQTATSMRKSRFGIKKYRLEFADESNFIELHSDNKIIIFIIGGITSYEKKIINELTKELGIEIILGGTSLCNMDDLILHLSTL